MPPHPFSGDYESVISKVATRKRRGVVDMSNGHNVIAVTFDEDSKAYQALNTLRQADRDGRVGIRSAVIVERRPEGTIRLQEGEDNVIGAGTAGGSLVGMLIGVLGGPVGMLLGLGTGMAVGAAVDLGRADDAED